MSKPLKEDYIIRIKSRIEQHVKEPVEQEEKEEFVELMTRGMAWLDTGTPEGMLNAAQYVEAVQSRQGLYIACPEEIAWEQGFISDEEVAARGQELRMTEYGQYLLSLVK